MTARWRLALLAITFVALVPAVWRLAAAMPAFGHPISLYGTSVNALAPGLRHMANMVSAVNFDIRGIDTLGEECMLLCAVTGAVVLLRGERGEAIGDRAGGVPGREITERADATTLVCRIAALLTLLLGVCVGLNGSVTPGGGFQGGAIAASGLLLVYLGDGYPVWRRMVRSQFLAASEGGGVLAFVLCAALPLAGGHAALANRLPLGTFREMVSGGMIWIVNIAVLFAVFGSFGLLLIEFMEETRDPNGDATEEKKA